MNDKAMDFSLVLSTWGGLGPFPGTTQYTVVGDKLIYTIKYFTSDKEISRECTLTPDNLDMLMAASQELIANKDELSKSDVQMMDDGFSVNGYKTGASFEFNNNNIAYDKMREIIDYIVSTKENNITEEARKEAEAWELQQSEKNFEGIGGMGR